MNIKVLTKKQLIKINGKEFYDLSENVYKSDDVFNELLGIEVVTKAHEMRLDLISLKWYGTTEYVDVILKANNIFNPFIIKEDDVLIIPILKQDKDIYKQKGTVSKTDLRKKYIDKERLSKNDIQRLKTLANKNKNRKNKLKTPLPPNMLADGRTNKALMDTGNLLLTNHHNKEISKLKKPKEFLKKDITNLKQTKEIINNLKEIDNLKKEIIIQLNELYNTIPVNDDERKIIEQLKNEKLQELNELENQKIILEKNGNILRNTSNN